MSKTAIQKLSANSLIATINQPNSIEKYEKLNQITVQSAIKGTRLVELTSEVGKETVLKSLLKLIKDAVSVYKLKHMIKEDMEFVNVAYSLLDKFPNETIEDFVLCFNMAKTGKLALPKHSLDLAFIHGWVHEYLQIKIDKIETDHHNTKHKINENAPFKALKGVKVEDNKIQQPKKSISQGQVIHQIRGTGKTYNSLLSLYKSIMMGSNHPEEAFEKELKEVRRQLNEKIMKALSMDKKSQRMIYRDLCTINYANRVNFS